METDELSTAHRTDPKLSYTGVNDTLAPPLVIDRSNKQKHDARLVSISVELYAEKTIYCCEWSLEVQ